MPVPSCQEVCPEPDPDPGKLEGVCSAQLSVVPVSVDQVPPSVIGGGVIDPEDSISQVPESTFHELSVAQLSIVDHVSEILHEFSWLPVFSSCGGVQSSSVKVKCITTSSFCVPEY